MPLWADSIPAVRRNIDSFDFNETNFRMIDTLASLPCLIKEGVFLNRVVAASFLTGSTYSSGLCCASHIKLALLASSGMNFELLLVSCMDSNSLSSLINPGDNPRKSR